MSNQRKRDASQINRTNCVVGGVIGMFFVLFGIFAAVRFNDAIGIFFTVCTAAFTVRNFYLAFGPRHIAPEKEEKP